MPVKPCRSNGKPGYKYGDSGKCYTYSPGNEASRKAAKRKAHKQQGAAVEANAMTLKVFTNDEDLEQDPTGGFFVDNEELEDCEVCEVEDDLEDDLEEEEDDDFEDEDDEWEEVEDEEEDFDDDEEEDFDDEDDDEYEYEYEDDDEDED